MLFLFKGRTFGRGQFFFARDFQKGGKDNEKLAALTLYFIFWLGPCFFLFHAQNSHSSCPTLSSFTHLLPYLSPCEVLCATLLCLTLFFLGYCWIE
ncbi:hypothetical protein HDV57DRAFT_207847 [Trichoderma longibrachiatum]